MRYYLRFALDIQRHSETNIVYTPESFVEEPVPLSVPAISEMITRFISSFEKVAVVKPRVEFIKHEMVAGTVSEHGSATATIQKPVETISSVEATVFIRQQQSLDADSFNALLSDLCNYIHETSRLITPETILSDTCSINFSGLREAIEIRNYLSRFAISSKKIYRSGYLYITVI
jgi:hypothetical protein